MAGYLQKQMQDGHINAEECNFSLILFVIGNIFVIYFQSYGVQCL